MQWFLLKSLSVCCGEELLTLQNFVDAEEIGEVG